MTALILLFVMVLGCIFATVYIRKAAKNEIIAARHRDQFYDAAAKLMNAPDDLVPTDVLWTLRAMGELIANKRRSARIARKVLAAGWFGRKANNNAVAAIDSEERSLPPEFRSLYQEAMKGLVMAVFYNTVFAGGLVRHVMRRSAIEEEMKKVTADIAERELHKHGSAMAA